MAYGRGHSPKTEFANQLPGFDPDIPSHHKALGYRQVRKSTIPGNMLDATKIAIPRVFS